MSCEGVSTSFQTGRLEWELQMLQLSATICSCITILWVSLVSLFVITLSVTSQRLFIVVVYFVMTQSRNFWIHPHTTLLPVCNYWLMNSISCIICRYIYNLFSCSSNDQLVTTVTMKAKWKYLHGHHIVAFHSTEKLPYQNVHIFWRCITIHNFRTML